MAHTILLIDDDQGILEVINKILKEEGFDVISALDGKKGLDMVLSNDPDLILLDIRMPNMNGYEFMRSLRAQRVIEGKPLTPVIMLTGIEAMEEVFKLEGAKGYLVKPVDTT